MEMGILMAHKKESGPRGHAGHAKSRDICGGGLVRVILGIKNSVNGDQFLGCYRERS